MKTNEGSFTYIHSLDHAVEFFSKAGSLFSSSKSAFYENNESALSLFQKTWIIDKELSFKLLLWLRDCRGGAGNRSGFRECSKWLTNNNYEKWIVANLDNIIEYGRFDDLREFLNTCIKKQVREYWRDQILKNNILAAKWADRKDFQLQRAFGTNEAGLRKILADIRKNHIVEKKMSEKNYSDINYENVPSVAMARYTNAFTRNDYERFSEYKIKLSKKEVKINASVLFPHDCVRTVKNGDSEIGNAQFDALPNYLENVNERIMVLCDTSGSMCTRISGSVELIDISQGLALYISDKVEKTSPFYRKFIGFNSESTFKSWQNLTFSQAVNSSDVFDGAVGSTRIDTALDLILKTANFFNLTNDQVPTTLLIVSDMQFSEGCDDKSSEPIIKTKLKKWKECGYTIPKIVYWNLAGYPGSPELYKSKNVCLVSGYSSSILKHIFSGTEITPEFIMFEALKKYIINIPT